MQARDPRRIYRERLDTALTAQAALDRASAGLSQLRVAAFAAIVVIGLVVERAASFPTVGALVIAMVAFVVFVARHRRVRERLEWQRELVRLNEQALRRLARDWETLPVRAPTRDIGGHAYAADLDLYGRASLTQILGPVGSTVGAQALDDWLLHRASPDLIRLRQDAVRELMPEIDLRESFAIHAQRTRDARPADLEQFLHWAERPGSLMRRPLLVIASWLLPVLTWSLSALHALGVIGTALWLVPLGIALVLYMTTGAAVRSIFEQAFGREAMFAHYPQLIATVTGHSFGAPTLRSLRARLEQQGESADHQLHRLQRLMHLADLRSSSMHLPVFMLTMWDLHILRALEAWQRSAGTAARDWLAAIGEFEAFSALATLAHDQPAWVFPEVGLSGGDPVFAATALGHPLLGDDVRVENDVRIGPPGTFLLVTGSNMSGKSTLLRAVGANAVLAQAGAPVCARELVMPPLEVYTSIRVQDSLARGVSYFMAELERLKVIVDAAHATRDAGTATLLFLLDEILHGTNTAERRIAARRVIRHLVDAGAIGAATTHDLELAEEPALAGSARLVHFREFFEGDDGDRPVLRFDYLLRPGLATSTNALALMRIVGLPAE